MSVINLYLLMHILANKNVEFVFNAGMYFMVSLPKIVVIINKNLCDLSFILDEL